MSTHPALFAHHSVEHTAFISLTIVLAVALVLGAVVFVRKWGRR